jgi:hypothetical protein
LKGPGTEEEYRDIEEEKEDYFNLISATEQTFHFTLLHSVPQSNYSPGCAIRCSIPGRDERF